MLQTAYEMVMNVKTNLDDFQKISTSFTSAFVDGLVKELDDDYKTLGIDNNAIAKVDKQNLLGLVDKLNNLLTLLQSAMKFNLRSNSGRFDLIAQSFLLTKYKKPYSRKALMEISLKITENIGSYKDELTAVNVPATQIDEVLATCTDYIDAFKNQNTNVSKAVNITDDQQVAFNHIYTEVRAIGEMGLKIYRKDKTKSKLFTYSAIVKQYTQSRPRKTAAQPAPTTTPTPSTPPVDDKKVA